MIKRQVQTFPVYDPGQDAVIPLLRVPDDHQYTIEKAWVTMDRTLAGSTANYVEVNLFNAGTAGTGTANIGGTAGSTAGWTANTPKEITITSGSGKLTAGEWLAANYAETGTVAPGIVAVTIEFVDGIGSKA